MNRTFRTVLPLAAAALLLAGCGEKEEPGPGSAAAGERDRVRLVLDYFPNADHAGIYAAQAAGEYARAGLDVQIDAPPDPAAPLKLLQAGRADLAISYEPELLLARDKGAEELVSVGALAQTPLTAVISLDGKVRSAKDLAGKRVGTAGIAYQEAYVRTIAEAAGVDADSIKITNVGFDLSRPMIAGRIDATLGSFWNYEGVDLARRGRKPTILRMEELGVPTYNELIFVARRKDLDPDGASLVRRFLQATARGHQRLREDPAAGVDALMQASSGLERELQEAVVEATLPVFFPADEDRPFGYQDPDEWQAYGDWMLENGLLKRQPNAGRALTNEFLAGEGLDPGPSGLE